MKIVGSLGRLTARLRTGAGVLGFARKQTQETQARRPSQLRRVLAAVAVASTTLVMGAGLAVPTVAHAQAPDSISCAFTGATLPGTLNPVIPQPPANFPPANENPQAEEGTAPFTTADPGTYAFDGAPTAPSSCTGVESNGAVDTATSITSNGNYYNIVCGTGTAYGVAYAYNGSTLVATVHYTIVFNGGAGTLTADVTLASDPGVTFDASGTVDITPSNTGGCVTGPVDGFKVVGSVSGSGTADVSDAA
ncbi:MAG: hypothetical protein ACYCO3_09315 [Mycobacteriales bacterium]